MNLDIFDLEAVEKELTRLPPLHRVAFAASCCERLLPNYSAFAREEGWGNPAVLRTALDEVWQILQGKPADAARIGQLREDCIHAMKYDEYDEEILKSEYNYEAEQAAIAIYNALEACLDPTPQLAVEVARCVVNTVDEFIRALKEIANPSWYKKPYEEQEEEIAHHPFIIREIAKQREDLQRLKEVETLDRDFLEWLRTSFDNEGRSAIDLS
jgi:uncharacterized protein YjaG (DUF416 family)